MFGKMRAFLLVILVISSEQLVATHEDEKHNTTTIRDSAQLTAPGSGHSHGHGHGAPVRVVCYYYAVEAWYRRGQGMFVPEDVDVEQCTHLNYAYASIDAETYLIKSHDPWAEIDNKFYERVTGLRKKNTSLRVLLSLGGWTEPGARFSALVAEPKSRKAFRDHTITFLKLHDFDGLDLAWFFPGCEGGECRKGTNSGDKQNFALFLMELRSAFDQLEPRLMLTAAVSGDPDVIDHAYDIPTLRRLDHLNVMTFDYVAYWNGKTGIHAPLYAQKGFPSNMNANFSLYYYIEKGIPAKKLVMGIPTYGRTFTLINPSSHGVLSPCRGPGAAGELTNSEGLLAYYEICDRTLNKKWSRAKDKVSGAPYAFSGDQWLSYETGETALAKARFVKENKFGGVLIWDIDRDDFRGSCYGLRFPILSAVTKELFGDRPVVYPDLRFDRLKKQP